MDSKAVVIIAEHEAGRVSPVSLELLTLARLFEREEGLEPVVLVLGADPEGPAREMARWGGARVIGLKNSWLAQYNNEVYMKILASVLPPLRPRFILTPNSTRSLDFAPGLALRLGGVAFTNVGGVEKKDGAWVFSRSIFNGKIAAGLTPLAEPAIIAVQAGVFRAEAPNPDGSGEVQIIESDIQPERVRTLGVGAARAGGSDLASAEVIVAAGRGIGKKENMDLAHRTAALFARSAVAGSRPVCDNGWLDYPRQVGMTGAVVAPKLYLACGISGAGQHVVGMRGSGFIVSISTDPHAAIFNISDVCVVEDLTVFLPTLLELAAGDQAGEIG
ncbi:MAG: electron transfer flavoprotein subunit alpha/FixB family protein [Pseudomonadota bacterium]